MSAPTMGHASEPAAPADNSQAAKPPAKIRKRAPKACLSCRARKVRCDVSQRGRPCMNCYLDSETCVVTGRASRFRRAQQENSGDAQASNPPYDNDALLGKTSEDLVKSRDKGEPPQTSFNDFPVPDQRNTALGTQEPSGAGNNDQRDSPKRDSEMQKQRPAHTTYPNFNTPPTREMPSLLTTQTNKSLPSSSGTSQTLWVGEQRVTANADVTYSYYRFLSLNNLHNVEPQDVNYLESQGCLRVPTRRILNDFVQQFFLHVHPILPLINEGDFWDMYCHQGPGAPRDSISLVTLQAMMFMSCTFVSKSSIKALGFPSIRAARAAFYRRAKLLYDLDTELSLVSLGQAALMMSFWSPYFAHGTRKPNSAWLGVAIQNAKSVEAHLQAAMPTFSRITHPVEHKKQNTLKRLWWCCIIRDRILPLGLRRSVQITRSHFDFDASPSLGYADLADEVGRSKVYSAETKQYLIEVLVHFVDLCILLTDLLMLVFPLDDAPGWGRRGSDEAVRTRECKFALRRWYKSANLRFPMFGGGDKPRMKTGSSQASEHESVILFTNLMYIYYHSARAALCHHEILQQAIANATPNLNNSMREFSNIFENRHELQDASSGVTECLRELNMLNLARWLPISAVACTALPLMLHIIDSKLSLRNHNRGRLGSTDNQAVIKQHRLNVLIEAMKTYQPQYDGVDFVSETVRHIVTLAQLDNPSDAVTASSNGSPSAIADWTDLLATQPGCYLRLAMTMDLSLSKGRLPEESDFPASLRGFFTAGFSTVRQLLDQGKSMPMPLGSLERMQPSSYMSMSHGLLNSIAPGTVQSISSDEDSTSPASVEGTLAAGNMTNLNATGMDIQMDTSDSIPTSVMPAGDSIPMTENLLASTFDVNNIADGVLAAYALDADGNTSSDDGGSGSDDGFYVDDGSAGTEMANPTGYDDWIEQAWTDEAIMRDIDNVGIMGMNTNVDAGSGVDNLTTSLGTNTPNPDQRGDGGSGSHSTAQMLLDTLQQDGSGVSCGA